VLVVFVKRWHCTPTTGEVVVAGLVLLLGLLVLVS
jgi:uncharacterized membrane protein (DUF485 family)